MKRTTDIQHTKKKCTNCKGKGFTFDGREYQENKWGGFNMVNVKRQCPKCHGRGVK